MADTVSEQEELSMEDILSSIKGILSDDGPEPKKEETPVPAEIQAAVAAENKDDDVFDLSSSMIVDVNAKEPSAATKETVSLPEIEPPAVPLVEFDQELNSLPEVPDINFEDLNAAADDSETDSLSDAFTINDNEEDILSLNSLEIKNPDEIDIDSEPIYSPEDEYGQTVSVEAEGEKENVIDVDSDPVYEPEEDTKPEINSEVSATSAEEPVVDVSADIIDNFARMFTEGKPAAVPVAEPETKVGDASLTVSDMIKSVIAEAMHPSIDKALAGLDAEILNRVRMEAAAQAKKWVDENLTRVVEEVVKEEVKRVMAKVGS